MTGRIDLGNCFQKSVACLFDMPLEEVPHFCLLYPHPEWWGKFKEFCIERNLYPLCFENDGNISEDYLHGRYLICVNNNMGILHSIVGNKGKVEYDPAGIKESYNIVSYTIFVSLMGILEALKK